MAEASERASGGRRPAPNWVGVPPELRLRLEPIHRAFFNSSWLQSGLNADLLDGYDADQLAKLAEDNVFTGRQCLDGRVTLAPHGDQHAMVIRAAQAVPSSSSSPPLANCPAKQTGEQSADLEPIYDADGDVVGGIDKDGLFYQTTDPTYDNQLARKLYVDDLLDALIADLGALAYLDTVATAQIDNDAVTYAKLQNVTTARILGRVTAGSGDAEELTAAQVLTLLSVYTQAQVDTTISALDHGNLNGLADDDHTHYHTDARALTWLGTRSTTDLAEGTNLYFTNARADGRIAAAVLSALSDVTLAAIATGEILKWSGTAWINQTLAEAGIAATSHAHAASDTTSGEFADARISESSVTQHQTALSITESQISDLQTYALASAIANAANWDTAYGWGDHASLYGTAAAVALNTAKVSFDGASSTKLAGIATDANLYVLPFTDNSTNWNSAHGWGDHAGAGYLASVALNGVSDVAISTPASGQYLCYNGSGWVNGAVAQSHVTGLVAALAAKAAASHTHVIANITDFTDNSTNWNTAYGWGDHAGAGYWDGANFYELDDVSLSGDTDTLANGTFLTVQGSVLVDRTPTQARSDMGLGDAATKNVGTTAGTVSAGDHTHAGYAPTMAGAPTDIVRSTDGRNHTLVHGTVYRVNPDTGNLALTLPALAEGDPITIIIIGISSAVNLIPNGSDLLNGENASVNIASAVNAKVTCMDLSDDWNVTACFPIA